jgi:hypothetical protein
MAGEFRRAYNIIGACREMKNTLKEARKFKTGLLARFATRAVIASFSFLGMTLREAPFT